MYRDRQELERVQFAMNTLKTTLNALFPYRQPHAKCVKEKRTVYFFLSEEEFRKKIDDGGFLEHAVFCGNYYGTPKDTVMQMIESGKDVILEIEVQGAMQVRSHYPEAVFIFVLPPSIEVLEERLRGRNTETDDVIKERLQRAKAEFRFIEKYNYILVNDTVENAEKTLGEIINAEKCSMSRNYKELKSEYID